MRHHRLLELFLAEELGMSWDRVHAEAEVLEHVLSEELEELIAARLGDPAVDPHGDPIPTPRVRDRRAPDAEPGRAAGRARGAVRSRVGFRPGDASLSGRARASRWATRLEVVDRQPFGGPVFVRFGERERPIGGELARAMRVAVDARRGCARRERGRGRRSGRAGWR